jgi:hypothetical protein
VAYDGHVVGNQKQREAEVSAQFREEIEHGSLDGDVQGGDRFISYQQLRLDRQGSGDADALALTTRKLPRVRVCHPRAKANQIQEFRGPPLRVLSLDGVMNVQRF